MRRIKEFQVLDHFNTRGTIPLGFDDVASGVGKIPLEAVQAALDLLAGRGWDVDGLVAKILDERDWTSAAEHGTTFFVSIHVR